MSGGDAGSAEADTTHVEFVERRFTFFFGGVPPSGGPVTEQESCPDAGRALSSTATASAQSTMRARARVGERAAGADLACDPIEQRNCVAAGSDSAGEGRMST